MKKTSIITVIVVLIAIIITLIAGALIDANDTVTPSAESSVSFVKTA